MCGFFDIGHSELFRHARIYSPCHHSVKRILDHRRDARSDSLEVAANRSVYYLTGQYIDVMTVTGDRWVAGDAYEAYMGRWSRPLARAFVEWLQPAPLANWLELGCGTGALTSAICDLGAPASIVACDPSEPFVEHARKHLPDTRASFVVAGSDALPRRDGGFDTIVSGLVLNFLPDPEAAVAAIRERLRRDGTAAAYVWDYAEGMEFLRVFWEEAAALDARADALNEGKRFPLCTEPSLASLFRTGGLAQVETGALEVPTEFTTFEDYWMPFLRGTGPAPSYVASLAPHDRELLSGRLARRLQTRSDGRIHLRARAWAVRGVAEGEPVTGKRLRHE
jgi:SAM-dependent methyltransferase